jgi:heme-degrading monooxygenase HmoA
MSDTWSITTPQDKYLRPYNSKHMKIVEMNEKVTLSTQLQQDVGAVIQISTYTVNPEDVDHFLKTWASAAEIAKKSMPGVISAQLHRGIAGSSVFVAYLVFESTEAIKQLNKNPDFPAILSTYPASTVVSPRLFKKVAVPGICVD